MTQCSSYCSSSYQLFSIVFNTNAIFKKIMEIFKHTQKKRDWYVHYSALQLLTFSYGIQRPFLKKCISLFQHRDTGPRLRVFHFFSALYLGKNKNPLSFFVLNLSLLIRGLHFPETMLRNPCLDSRSFFPSFVLIYIFENSQYFLRALCLGMFFTSLTVIV